MPKWLKITLIIAGIGLFVLVAGGFLAARALKRGAENFEAAIVQASADGKSFGTSVSLDRCVEEGVRRSGDCGGLNLTCVPKVAAFLWGCLEAAPYEAAFCELVPRSDDDDAVMGWGRHTCSRHGQGDRDLCVIAVATVPGFCTAKRQAR